MDELPVGVRQVSGSRGALMRSHIRARSVEALRVTTRNLRLTTSTQAPS